MKIRKSTNLLSAAAFALLACGAAQADEAAGGPFQTHFYPDTIIVEPTADEAFNAAVDLIVRGPNGFRTEQSFAPGALIEFNPKTLSDKPLADGTYVWELRIAGTGQNLARSGDSRAGLQSERQSIFDSRHGGSFAIQDGKLASPELQESAQDDQSPKQAGAGLTAIDADEGPTLQQTISGDLTVYNSLCVGFDCAASESYGADTIRLKENNMRIHFDDTSSSASFPANDWRIVANDQANGGLSRYTIQDATSNRNVSTIEAGAPSNSLYVDNAGRLGLGTNNPVVEMHAVNGDSPTLRLEQDGSSGFAPQTWDVAGNETNFFVRDATNGSTLPFRIRPSAPSSSLYINTNGAIGVGTASPSQPMHIKRSDNTAQLLIEETGAGLLTMFSLVNNGFPVFNMQDTSQTNVNWAFRLSGNEGTTERFEITKVGTGAAEFELYHDGSARFLGDVTANGVLLTSARATKTDFQPVDAGEILDKLASLEISEWRYHREPEGTRHIGAVAEEFQAVFGLSDGKTLNMIDTTGVSFAAIKALKEELDAKQREVDDLSAKVAQLEEAVATLLSRTEEN
jgi:hypothetical protein